ncbi:MAG: PilZ domain-containing protein [Bryobacterales bacterium]|nr:PilZ domain-containing protein [Bryobacterales bacterium]
MERRREPRVECWEPVRIELLGESPLVLSGMLVNISGQGARLQAPRSLPINGLLRIDAPSGVYLGDVCYCTAKGELWHVGVKVAHSIRSEHGLLHLANRLRQETGSPSPILDPKNSVQS